MRVPDPDLPVIGQGSDQAAIAGENRFLDPGRKPGKGPHAVAFTQFIDCDSFLVAEDAPSPHRQTAAGG